MEITSSKEDGLRILFISGKINGINSVQLENVLTELIEKGENAFVLDMKNVHYLSSAGLRVILMATKRLYGKGTIALARLQKGVEEIFEMTGFDTIVSIHRELESAKSEVLSSRSS